MHSPGRFRASSRSAPRHWDADTENHGSDAFLASTIDRVKPLQSVPRRVMHRESSAPAPRRWPPPMETPTPMGFNDWPFDTSSSELRVSSSMDVGGFYPRLGKGVDPRDTRGFDSNQVNIDRLQDSEDYKITRTRAFQMDYEIEPRHSANQMQRYQQQRQYQRNIQQEYGNDPTTSQLQRRTLNHAVDHELYAREMTTREPLDNMPFESSQRVPRNTSIPAPAPLRIRSSDSTRDAREREMQNRGYNALASSTTRNSGFERSMDDMPLEPATLDTYPDEEESSIPGGASMSRRHEFAQASVPSRQQLHHQMPRRCQYGEHPNNDEMTIIGGRSFHDQDLHRDRRASTYRAAYEELVPTPTSASIAQNNDYRNLSSSGAEGGTADLPSSRQQPSHTIMRPQKGKRLRIHDPPFHASTDELAQQALKTKTTMVEMSGVGSSAMSSSGMDSEGQPKRRCGRKSMNYSSEQKRERNRAAVKKCRQRQALKLEYLQHKAESLAAENQALSEMLVKNTELAEDQRTSLTRGIQMDILLKLKEIFTQSLPKDFVLDADSIWDLNSVLAVSMPSRCYYGIESIKDFWRTSLRMRNKGKIRSFWAWLFRLPPGDRFSEFEIQPFSSTSNLYFISWTTKSIPPLAGSMVIMFGNGHRVTLHVECFGWLIWRYLLTNEPFPEPLLE